MLVASVASVRSLCVLLSAYNVPVRHMFFPYLIIIAIIIIIIIIIIIPRHCPLCYIAMMSSPDSLDERNLRASYPPTLRPS